MLEISTGKNRKEVNIDGHVYLVRKPGAGEQLTISQAMRELNKYEGRTDLTDDEEGKAIDLSQKIIDLMAACFDDQGDGSKSRELINSLAPDELQNVLAEIFKDEPEPATTNTA